MVLRRPLRTLFGLWSVACASFLGCGVERDAPGLMLVFQSDMAVPKDVKAVSLYVRVTSGDAAGRILYNGIARQSDGKVQFPATFLLASVGKPAVTRIQLVAYRTRATPPGQGELEPFVLREVTSTVPTDRLARLRMPLLWINQESVPQTIRDEWMASGTTEVDFEAGFPSNCAADGSKIFRGGSCVAADADIRSLPDYRADEDDPLKASSCFDTEGCFSKSTNLAWDATNCSVAKGSVDPSFLNLALVTADGAGIEIKGAPSSFVIPLDQGPSQLEGYYIDRDRIVLSKVVCNALKSGKATRLVGTGACNAKTESANLCGSWNPATTKAGPLPGRTADLPGMKTASFAIVSEALGPHASRGPDGVDDVRREESGPRLRRVDIDSTTGNNYQKDLVP